MQQRISVLAAALWWGSLSAVGFFVVPMLFAHLQPAAVAGTMAARLFTGQTWISVACGMLLLIVSRPKDPEAPVPPSHAAIVFIVAGLLLALLAEFAVAPRIVARENLKLWHAVGSGMYLLQWLCAGICLWRCAAPRRAGS